MTVNDVIKYIEEWAPPGAGWERDNVGLQVGNPESIVTNVLLALDVDENVVQEAIRKNCNFIFTHHPFLFFPLKSINTTSNPKGKIINSLIKNDISLFSAHTNLDFTIDGVSFKLAEKLGLGNIGFLQSQKANQYKLAAFVPEESVEKVSEALYSAGAGKIGNYTHCGFSTNGTGTFLGNEKSNPQVGEKNKTEFVNEVKLETLVNVWDLHKVLNALKDSHPYEEPAYDIYRTENVNVNYGSGAIGTLNEAMSEESFLNHVCDVLKLNGLRYNRGTGKDIKKVAVCGGSGSEFLGMAIKNKADAFITADIKYHTFQDAENKCMMIDAGHYETEIIVMDEVKARLENLCDGENEKVEVFKYSANNNPMKVYNYNK